MCPGKMDVPPLFFFGACLFIPPTCISEPFSLACLEYSWYSWGFNELNWRDCWRLRFAVKPHFTSGGMIHDIVILPQDQDVDVSLNTETMFVAPWYIMGPSRRGIYCSRFREEMALYTMFFFLARTMFGWLERSFFNLGQRFSVWVSLAMGDCRQQPHHFPKLHSLWLGIEGRGSSSPSRF